MRYRKKDSFAPNNNHIIHLYCKEQGGGYRGVQVGFWPVFVKSSLKFQDPFQSAPLKKKFVPVPAPGKKAV